MAPRRIKSKAKGIPLPDKPHPSGSTGDIAPTKGAKDGCAQGGKMVKTKSLAPPEHYRDEWNFSRFFTKFERNNPAARACMIYEYARESPSVREVVVDYRNAVSKRAAADALEANRVGRLPMLETMKALADETRALARMNKLLRGASGGMVFCNEPGFPMKSWQSLQSARTIDRNKHGRAALLLPPWKVESDALAIKALAPKTTPVVPCFLAVDTSAKRDEIKAAILDGLEELLNDLGIGDARGGADAADALKQLTALRLLNRFPKAVVMAIGDEATNANSERQARPFSTWQNYTRAREKAREWMHKLFDLPTDEIPISFPMISI